LTIENRLGKARSKAPRNVAGTSCAKVINEGYPTELRMTDAIAPNLRDAQTSGQRVALDADPCGCLLWVESGP
jgi:hypothetical protein